MFSKACSRRIMYTSFGNGLRPLQYMRSFRVNLPKFSLLRKSPFDQRFDQRFAAISGPRFNQTRYMSSSADKGPSRTTTTTTTDPTNTPPHVTHVTHITNIPPETNFRFLVNKFCNSLKYIFFAIVGIIIFAIIFCMSFVSNYMKITDDYIEMNIFGNYMKIKY